MMKIDAHHHLWRYQPAEYAWIDPESRIAHDFMGTNLAATLAKAGVGGAITVQARQAPEETRFLIDAAQSAPILGVVGWIDLRSPAIEALLEVDAHPLIVGYRHVVQDEADNNFILSQEFIRGVRAVVARDLTYDLLVNHRQLSSVVAFVESFGNGRFVLDHAAKPDIARGGWSPWAEDIAAVAALPNVFCKVSGLVTEANHTGWKSEDFERYLDHIFALFGPERLIWGSDWPVCLLAADYRQALSLIEEYIDRHCPADRAAILGGNAIRAYALTLTERTPDP
jgi:L-fuconolactonase